MQSYAHVKHITNRKFANVWKLCLITWIYASVRTALVMKKLKWNSKMTSTWDITIELMITFNN